MITNSRVKLCSNPECWEVNPSNMAQCKECGTSLINVRAVMREKIDLEISKKREKQIVITDTEAISEILTDRMVRICDCGHSNPVNLRLCEKCGDEISDVIPICKSMMEKNYYFEALDDEFRHNVINGIYIVGKEQLMQKEFVSEKHAEISFGANGLLIRDLKSTNGTYINNKEIKPFEWNLLHDGDELAFGGKEIDGKRQSNAAYFKVKVK